MKIQLNLSVIRITGKEESVKISYDFIKKMVEDYSLNLNPVELTYVVSFCPSSEFGPATIHVNPEKMNGHAPEFLQKVLSYLEGNEELPRLNISFSAANWSLKEDDVKVLMN